MVVVYLAIIQGGGRLLGAGIDAEDGLATTGNLLRTGLAPIAVSAAFAIVVATWLGWWPRIMREEHRVQPWTRVVPVALLLAALLGTSWVGLVGQQAGLVACFVVMVLVVGFTEELMFRGIGLNVLRDRRMTERRVALHSSLIFGAVHLSNALSTGGQAVEQAVVVSFSGYLFYLTRRRFGSIWPAMLVHASQDFALLSGKIGVDATIEPQALLVLVVMVGLGVLVFRRRHRIELEPAAGVPSAGGA